MEDAITQINEAVFSVPKLYGQDGVKDKMIYLHYFYRNQDWYITEYDRNSLEAFGYVNLGYGNEMGYMSIPEIVSNGKVELDFYFEPTLWSKIDNEKDTSFDKQNNSKSYEDESDIDFYFEPPNNNGTMLMKLLKNNFDSVRADKMSTNSVIIRKMFSDIQFEFEAFDNTTEFKFTCLNPTDYFVSLEPVPTTENGKLRDLKDISFDIGVALTDAMIEYVDYANNKKFANNTPIDYTNDIEELTMQLMKINYADAQYNVYGFYNDVAKRYYSGDERVKLVVDEALRSQYSKTSVVSFDVTSYKNPYELNKAIEKWIDDNVGSLENVSKRTYSTEEKMFIKNYTGYGGLGKFGETTVGSMFEFFTPSKVIKVMWALAYKYGYSVEKSILETSVGTGEFLQFASPNTRKLAYEINQYSAIITKILYPTTEVVLAPFEKMFIKDNYTIKGKVDNLEKFDMVIGNPHYGSFDVLDPKASRYLLGMGEKDYTKANNYVEYFLRRSLDVLKPNGLIVMIVGAELKNGGTMFLDSKESPVKQFLNENAVLLDAYRLPDSTFERTGVTSDILVIQKK